MNSYQMVLHRPVEPARILSNFTWPEDSVRRTRWEPRLREPHV